MAEICTGIAGVALWLGVIVFVAWHERRFHDRVFGGEERDGR